MDRPRDSKLRSTLPFDEVDHDVIDIQSQPPAILVGRQAAPTAMHDDSSIAGPSSSVNGTSGGAPAVGTATSVDFKSPYTTWQTRLHLDLDTTKYQDLKTRIEAEASQTGGRHEMNFLLFRGRRVADEETWRTAVKDVRRYVSSPFQLEADPCFSFGRSRPQLEVKPCMSSSHSRNRLLRHHQLLHQHQ